MTQQEYFTKLIELLKLEKQADLEEYNTLISQSTLKEKINKGICWEPLIIKETGYGLGDYPYVVVERVKNMDVSHQFAAGKPVSIYLASGDSDERSNGTIHFVSGNVIKIILSANDLPHWLTSGRIGIQLLFDEKSYEEIESTLKLLSQKNIPNISHLIDIIFNNKPQNPSLKIDHKPSTTLNPSQNQAVASILGNQDLCIVHGPPGTGKTTTLVEAIAQLTQTEKHILVCAPSNAAVDLLTEKLAQKKLNVIRIGNLSRIDQTILNHTIDQKLTEHESIKLIKQIKKQSDEYRRIAFKYNGKLGKDERTQRNLLLKEAKNCIKDAIDLENAAIEQILNKAQVITCTLIVANHRYLQNINFDTVVIDEAAQALEPATWIPILKAPKIVLAGDPYQLPPTIKSENARKQGLETTLIEKAMSKITNVNLLNIQYRMNEHIMGFSNQYFYQSALQAHPSNQHHTLSALDLNPVLFIDTAGCGFDEKTNPESLSYYNPEEWQTIQTHLAALMEQVVRPISIGIISPYKSQIEWIRTHIDPTWIQKYDITINTIDSFQGQERDLIYITLVRSNKKSEIGFLRDYRRMNVAMTRARKKLVIVGDSATLGKDPFYAQLLQYIETINAYQSAWEYIQ